MSIETQLQIRCDSHNVQEYVKDLNSWLEDGNFAASASTPQDFELKVIALKLSGNSRVEAKDWNQAESNYSEAIELCKIHRIERSILATLLLNRSLVHLKRNKYSHCVRDCSEAIKLNLNSPKAFFRKALGLMGTARWDEARKNLLTCLDMVKSDDSMTQTVRNEINRLACMQANGTQRYIVEARRRIHTKVPSWVLHEPCDEDSRILPILGDSKIVEQQIDPTVPSICTVNEKYIPKATRLRNPNFSSCPSILFQYCMHAGKKITRAGKIAVTPPYIEATRRVGSQSYPARL